MTESAPVDHGLEDFVVVTEIAEGQRLAEDIFQAKYRAAAPGHGHHVFALLGGPEGWQVGSYINYLPHRNAMLVGGACTNGEVLRQLPARQRELIEAAGGLMLQTVRYAEQRFSLCSVGTFGHCGDARSWSILSQCGYQRLDHPYLIVRWNRDLPEAERTELVASVAALGEF
ncbi:MAG: hypothetical protein EA370_10880 [Wenzhouxiangella sp.]|nr:MAG: hypothetical protein EA370_10880 [Wenzhouxiangella sp.]